MNNIELRALQKDVIKYLKDEIRAELAPFLPDQKLHALKREIEKLKKMEKQKLEESNEKEYSKKLVKRKVDEIFRKNPKLEQQRILQKSKDKKNAIGSNIGQARFEEKVEKVMVDPNRKPKVLFICDVRDWAWWIKSEYIKKYLSDEFDIDIKCVIGTGCTGYHKINQKVYDLYFTYGYSYIDFLNRVPKSKKVTGITAHRSKGVIFPRMKVAGHHHANSMMLLRELQEMGFRSAFYVPNGVDEELFSQEPIDINREMVVGHVGKTCPAKGQKDIILPAMAKASVKSVTEMATWQNKRPHKEMPKVYKQMDVMIVASTEDGTPNPALEAASCGRPIISNRIGNMPEFIVDGYNGFLVEKNINAYVEKINYFKNNREELIRMGNNARKTVEEGWTWKIQSENYRKMFNSIFKRG